MQSAVEKDAVVLPSIHAGKRSCSSVKNSQ